MQRIVINGGKPLSGRVPVSGSKNATLPLMAATLLGRSPSVIRNVPDLRDVQTMADVLRSLGATVDFSEHTMRIDPAGFSNTEAPYDMVRKMRASIYVMGPMLARLREAKVSLPGGCAIGSRPVDLHLKGFQELGADIALEHGYILAKTNGLRGAEFNLSGAAGSSVGATCNVVMAACLASGTTVIRGAACEPDVVELMDFLTKMGARIEGSGTSTITVQGVESLEGIVHSVVSDRIEAGTFMTAAAITRGDLIIENCPSMHMEATISKMQEIGVVFEDVGDGLRVRGNAGDFRRTDIQTATYPGFPTDMQAQLMAFLATVPGTSIIKETIYVDRFLHAAELVRLGASIRVLSGIATIEGVERLSGAPVMASDLRASAALVVAGLAAEGTTIVNRVYHIDRGYESIEKKLRDVGATIARVSDNEPDDATTPPF
ncbi:MAG: UDP-N-acetylglucosamine 1-carboxyvinyltransferase [Candidatus Sumerlaeaceae bacterium]|nr:UDP-N-acetylglucosamine 1-carboxyvinyltransferase [Candidatus Sumerlaeaceae bacterium]